MNARAYSDLNPLRCHGTALPPNLLLTAKLIFLCLLLRGDLFRLPEPFLPLLPILDHLPRPDLMAYAFRAIAIAAGVALLTNRSVRAATFTLGAVLFVALLANRGAYRNGMFFCVCMLVLIGLYGPPRGLLWVRLQFPILFAGAALNKLLEADWRSGRYFEHWMHEIIESPIYSAAAALFPAGKLSLFMCWTTIVLQLAFAIGVMLPRLRPVVLCAVLGFYVSSVVLAGTTFGIFFSVLVVSLLVFVDWPEPGSSGSSFHRLMFNPATYFVMVVLINVPAWYLNLR